MRRVYSDINNTYVTVIISTVIFNLHYFFLIVKRIFKIVSEFRISSPNIKHVTNAFLHRMLKLLSVLVCTGNTHQIYPMMYLARLCQSRTMFLFYFVLFFVFTWPRPRCRCKFVIMSAKRKANWNYYN